MKNSLNLSHHQVVYINEQLKIVNTRSRGRCLSVSNGSKGLQAGQTVLIESPLACIPNTDSTYPSISLYSGKYKLDSIEFSMQKAAGEGFKGYAIILAARCLLEIELLKSRKPSKGYKSIELWENLVTNVQLVTNEQFDQINASAAIVLRLLESRLILCQNSSSQFNLSTCKEALLKLSNNAFTIVDDFNMECGKAVYLLAAVINHSCCPNAVQRYDDKGRIHIIATRRIFANEEILISYIDIAQPTMWRRLELHQYGFLCTCRKCCSVETSEVLVCKLCREAQNRMVLFADSSYQYMRWMRGSYPIMRLENSFKLVKEAGYPVPYGDSLLFSDAFASEQFRCSHCSHCDAAAADYKLALVQIQNSLKLIDSYSFSASYQQNYLRSIRELTLKCQSTISPKHYISVYCQRLLRDAVALSIIHSKEKSKGPLPYLKEYLQVFQDYYQNISIGYFQFHPNILIQRILAAEQLVEVLQVILGVDLSEVDSVGMLMKTLDLVLNSEKSLSFSLMFCGDSKESLGDRALRNLRALKDIKYEMIEMHRHS